MKDFRFNDFDDEESSGYNQNLSEKKRIIKFIIIAIVALTCGLTVYFVTDSLFNGNKEPVAPVSKDTELEVNDEMVIYLYDNISYTVKDLRNDKFFKADKVLVDDFTTQDKFYYALRYAVAGDFIDMSTSSDELDEDGNTKDEKDKFITYSISNTTINEYMYNFFGEDITYSTDTPVTVAVNFSSGKFNEGILKYDTNSDSFLIQFDSASKSADDMAINPYLYKLDSALLEGATGNIIIKEKIVFTEYTQNKDESGTLIDSYDYKIYSDYAKSNLIEQNSGVTKSDLMAIGIENFKDSATVISYTFFKDSNDEYHFLSSEIEK